MYHMNYLEYDCICEYLTSNIFINNISFTSPFFKQNFTLEMKHLKKLSRHF